MHWGTHVAPEIPGLDWSERCAGCEGECRIVPSDGPVPCRLFLIGERPGQDEMRRSMRPFTGKSGRELNENYLNLAGTSRDEVYICNTVHCGEEKNKTPGKPLIASCSQQFMPLELEAVKPTFIIPMGGVACSLFDNIHLKTHHGMPIRRKIFDRTYWVVPQYHPASGLHDTRNMTSMLEDWNRLRSIIDGDYRIPLDNYKKPAYRIVRGRREVEAYLKPAANEPWIHYGGLDTETDQNRLWCITLSIKPGTGIMLMADDVEGLAALRELCDHYHWFIHNAIFDLDKLSERDIVLKHLTCTMQAAYHRGNLPQGLKQLAWRLLGITMTEYEDVVVPQSKKKLLSWWQDALLALEEADNKVIPKFHKKTGKPIKPQIVQTPLFKRMLQIYTKGCGESETYDMWKMFDILEESAGIVKGDRRHVIDMVGQPPRQSIVHVPLESTETVTGAIEYASRDADAVLRLGIHLRSQEREIRHAMTTMI